MTDHAALLCIGSLARRESGGADRVLTVLRAALNTHERGARITAREIGELLVILEYGPLWMKGAATCEMTTNPETLIAMTALQAQDIHQFSMSDLTRDQRVEGARKELAQYEKYEVWHPETPNFIVDEKEIPRGATVVSSTHVERPKLVQKKNEDGTLSNMRELVCKGRLCLRGFEVAGLWGARTDAPTISRSAFLLFLTICMWMAFDFLSVDISAAFLKRAAIRG